VFLDGIEGGNLVFNAKGYVSSPRSSYGVRSALLFTLLQRLHEAGLEVSSPPTMLLASAPQATALQPPTAEGPGAAAAPAATP
jgi:small-conductance mechanosensitive channel